MRHGIVLFREEIYAWQHGPVVPDAYYRFSGYGASRIQNRYDTEIDPRIEALILPVIEKLRMIDPWTLVEMTHKKGLPWDRVFNDKVDPTGLIDKGMLYMDKTDLGVE